MATIESVSFSITRTSYPDGNICSIDYSYYIHLDKQQFNHHSSLSVAVALFGDDLLADKIIGEPPYDTHSLQFDSHMPVNRRFVVPCEILDEAVGIDKIFLKLYVHTSDGESLTEKTATIKDWF